MSRNHCQAPGECCNAHLIPAMSAKAEIVLTASVPVCTKTRKRTGELAEHGPLSSRMTSKI